MVDLRTEAPSIGGLSNDGFKFVEESQRFGIVVDMAHATDKAIDQACEVAKSPIVYSHGSIGRFTSSYRSSASAIMSISRATARKIAATGGRNFVGFEMNKNAYDAFLPTLDQVEQLPDPIPIEPDAKELAKREKMRQGWRNDRAKRKAAKLDSNLFE